MRNTVDFASLDFGVAEQHALSGNYEPLAKHVESGAPITPGQRRLIAKILRGEIKFKRGNRSTFAQEELETKVCSVVRAVQHQEALLSGSRGSLSRAISRYLDVNQRMNPETLRRYVKGRGLSKEELQIIDKIRAEMHTEASASKLG
jgi:hypothetical protein